MFFLYLAITCALAGGIVGYFAARSFRVALIGSVIFASVLIVVAEWCLGAPGEWSWRRPVESAMYLAGPFVVVFLLPAVIAAVTVGSLRRRRLEDAPTI